MTDQWEQYVEAAAISLDPGAFDKTIENHDGYVREFRRDRATELARGVLAAVGPLIAEGTRVRMVEAAGRAVERDAITPAYQPSMKQLALINNALLSGSGMTQANVAFRELCRGYGVDRFALEDER